MHIISTMEIEITGHTPLSEIRKAFKAEFPFLDIAFFSKEHEEGAASLKKNLLDYQSTCSEAGDPHRIGLLQISGDQTASETEKELETGFGLHIQIMRKSGNVWLQTTTSDDLSLNDLNEEARQAAEFEPDKAEPEDYHEQE